MGSSLRGPYVRKLDKNGNVSTAFQEPMLPEIEGKPVEPTLKKLRVVLILTTTTDTSTIHGEFTDLREAVTYLRKLADEIETELRSEQKSPYNPSS